MKSFKRFYQFCLETPGYFAAMVVILLVTGVAESILPLFYKAFVDAIMSGSKANIFTVLSWYIALRFFILLAGLVRHYVHDVVLIAANRSAYLAVFRKIQTLDFSYQINKTTGSLISAMKRGEGAFFGFFFALNYEIPLAVISFAVLFISFSFVDMTLVGILALTLMVEVALGYYLIRFNIQTRRAFNKVEDAVSGIVVDNFLNYETVKYFAKEAREFLRLKKEFVPWTEKIWGYAYSFYYLNFFAGIIGTIGLVSVLLYSIQLFMTSAISTGELVMILGFVTAFYDKLFRLLYQFRDVFKQSTDLEKFFSVLDESETVLDPKHPITMEKVSGDISFDSVHFSYPDGKEHAVHDMSLNISAGESIAFVGPSGAGKTTLTKLLLRLFDPDSGTISIDGVDIKDMEKTHLRSHIGVVPQEPILFNASIGFNIGYGLDQVSQAQIEEAATLAQLHDFILTLPDGYETQVGERGVKLSGGQKQRLAIARMILSKPEIIIFDEATSQLDSESEKLIQKAFWKVSKNITTLIIAHRLSTVKKADRIVVIDDGKIVEQGPHTRLLQKKGRYKKLWDLQS
ncbi:MAG: ABC transporter ATP-binding protein [Pseudomonadales bacterium]|nr:ABC transporter ATP-binding protein [Pseudomonadales bacterium]